jgi:hypothetical protein
MPAKFWKERLKGIDLLEDLGTNKSIILELILRKRGVRA